MKATELTQSEKIRPERPSAVDLRGMFVGTFDRLEIEGTAAVIVQVLANNGDEWRSATCDELAEGFGLLTRDEGHWRTWFNNPFMKIDMHGLVDRGFATWDGDRAIRFTDEGLSRMGKWVNSHYRVRHGGLMRCCLQTLDDYMLTAKTTPQPGQTLDCRYHEGPSMIVAPDGVWQWVNQ